MNNSQRWEREKPCRRLDESLYNRTHLAKWEQARDGRRMGLCWGQSAGLVLVPEVASKMDRRHQRKTDLKGAQETHFDQGDRSTYEPKLKSVVRSVRNQHDHKPKEIDMSEENKEIKTKIEDLSEGGLKDETLKEASGGIYTGGLGSGGTGITTGTSCSNPPECTESAGEGSGSNPSLKMRL